MVFPAYNPIHLVRDDSSQEMFKEPEKAAVKF
jgi:hypothetical protein